MRRQVVSLAAWFVVAGGSPLAAQRAPDRPIVRVEEPRPAPILPAVLVPFTIPDSWCQGPGGNPRVTLQVFNLLQEPLRSLTVRRRPAQVLDRLPMRCGSHVAFWDGTVGDPPHLPMPTVYYLRLRVQREGRRDETATVRLVVPQY